ncbi:MAG: MFS transporter [Planctomycetales bacterium]|nr:MFS transporter [Planctomycetales bacterium]
MNFLATPARRRFLFAALYFSEGAPIGYLWLALPTRWKAAGVPLEQITWLTALLVLPWTFKFAWAPIVDVLRGRRWHLKHWIIAAQSLMAATLSPLLWLDPTADFNWIGITLFCHALCAATQDVAIDALCIAETEVTERGSYNGWMQAGMLLGRACMGGGALILGVWLGQQTVVCLLIACIAIAGSLVILSDERSVVVSQSQRLGEVNGALRRTLKSRTTWLGLLFALFGGAAFKSLEAVYGPFLIDRGYDELEVGALSAAPMIGAMMVGALLGGWWADRCSRRQFVAGAGLYIVLTVSLLAISDLVAHQQRGFHLPMLLVATAVGIGVFTAASYALFMDITDPILGASQFSAYMGATNGCEAWSTFAIGQIIVRQGYSSGMFAMSAVALAALLLLIGMKSERAHA